MCLSKGGQDALGIQTRNAAGREIWTFSASTSEHDDAFPPYAQNITDAWKRAYTFSTAELLAAVNKAHRVFEDLKMRLQFGEESLRIDHADFVNVFDIEYVTPGRPLEEPVFCNLKYVREPLQRHFVEEEHVTVQLSGDKNPIGFYRRGELVGLVCPCRW